MTCSCLIFESNKGKIPGHFMCIFVTVIRDRVRHSISVETWPHWGFVSWLNYRPPHQGQHQLLCLCAHVSSLMSGICTGRSLENIFGTNIIWKYHCFCHKGHLVVKLETRNGMRYLVKIFEKCLFCLVDFSNNVSRRSWWKREYLEQVL
jgi:hypothetical protein